MLTVVSFIGRKNGRIIFFGKCDCGKDKVFKYGDFKRGSLLSCGCNRTPKVVTYDYTHPLYKIWIALRARCNNSNDAAYANYGGRGVKVCEEWKNSYQLFFDWCILNGWKHGLLVDKDTKGNGLLYSPNTCAIVTRAQNNQARYCNVVNIEKAREIRGLTITPLEISKKYNISRSTAWMWREV